MRLFPLVLLAGTLASGCALREYSRNALTASGEAPITITPQDPAGQARREALQLAEVRARDQLLAQILAMKMANGQSVEEAAVKDPSFQAALQDAVRAGHVNPNSQKVTDTDAQLSVYMDLTPVQKLLQDYPSKNR